MLQKNFTWIVRLALSLVLIAFAFPIDAQEEPTLSVTLSQRLKLKEHYKKLVTNLVNAEVASAGLETKQHPNITVALKLDNDKLTADARAHLRRAREATKQQIFELTKPFKAATTRRGGGDSSGGVRFGRLNIDLDNASFKELLDRPQAKNSGGVNVSLQVSDVGQADFSLFAFDPADYILEVLVAVALSVDIPEELHEPLKEKIIDALELKSIGGEKAAEWITISQLPAPVVLPPKQYDINDWSKGLLAPDNSTLGILIAVALLGLFILVATFLIVKVFGSMAAGIKELKPAAAAGGSGGSSAGGGSAAVSGEVSADGSTTIVAGASDAGSKRGHDSSAATQALTSEMRNIRDQLKEIAQVNEQTFAELLRDMYYEGDGLENLKDLLSFVGYQNIRGGLDRLPPECIEQLRAYIEDTREEPVSLLNGVEVAQRLYRDCASRVSSPSDFETSLDNLRLALVSTDDAAVKDVMQNASAQELAFLLKTITIERGNLLVKAIDSAVLKEACALLDSTPNDHKSVADKIIANLEKSQPENLETHHHQLRFLLRMAKRATVIEEPNIVSMFGPEEWEFKRELMKVKFPYMWAKYLPADQLRIVTESFGQADRAQIIFLVDEELRNAIMGTYEEGSKLLELLQSELDLIAKNEKKAAEIEKNKAAILDRFAGAIRQFVASQPEVIDEVIKKQCAAENLNPPDWLEEAEPSAA